MMLFLKTLKRYIEVVIVMVVINQPAQSQTPSSTINFDERVYSFGTILEQKGKVTHTFVFHNKGTLPVVIADIHSDCGCIGKTVSKDPVRPGGKGEVVITFNPAYKAGFFSKEILVYSNNGQNYNRIWVEGKVTPAEHPVEDDYPYNFGTGLYLRLKVMAFGYLKPGETKQMELHYANNTNKEMMLDFLPAGVVEGLKFSNPGKIGAKAKGIVLFSFTMPTLAKNDVMITLYPRVNNTKLKETLLVKVFNANKLTKPNSK